MNGARLTLLVGALVFVAALSGCGGGSDATGAATGASSGGKASEFAHGATGKKYANFGHEAGAKEREQASETLEENLKAREVADWATQCETLSAKAQARLEGNGGLGASCEVNLKAMAEPVAQSAEVRQDPMSGPISALVVKGPEGYALFHGKKKHNYAMLMEEDHGRWRVGELVTIQLS